MGLCYAAEVGGIARMSLSAAPALVVGQLSEQAEIWALVAGAAGLAALALLIWRVRSSQRQYALDLEELERVAAEERERAAEAQERAAAVARESQAKSEMLATLSREVRGHLNGIMGSADLLLDEPLAPAPRQHVSTLRASAESLHRSLNDVLDYSSLETGQIRIAQAPFDLAEPLVEVVEQLSPLALLKSIDLLLIVAPDAPRRVIGDATRLRQILLNLTANAVKFTASGRVVLRVGLPPDSAAPSIRGATWMHFSVSDTGPGIPEEMQATLFERLGGPEAASPRRFGGSGLELAISKRLVGLMGGSIGARNLPESGSEFWVVLPLAPDTADAPPPPRILPAELHAVVLDGLAASRVAISTMFTRLGVEHDVTDLLPEALGLLRDTLDDGVREQVLLVDEAIAAAHAADLAGHLRGDAGLRKTRVVLMARDPGAAAATAAAIGAAAVLRKPLLRAEHVVAALGRGPVAAPPPPAREHPLVLVVDDDEISRSVASQLLGRQGCTVETVVSGLAALERAQGTAFDLIFMDCQMPGLDGFEATRRIRAALGAKAPPVVALTANTSPADRERAFGAGMVDFVDKPVRRAELIRVVNRWIPGRS